MLSILAILTAVSIPSVDGILKERQAREPVSELLTLAREVRGRAMREQRPYQIVFDSDGFQAARYFNPYGGREEFDKLRDLLRTQQEQLDIIEASRRRNMSTGEDTPPGPRLVGAMAGLTYAASYEISDRVDYRLRSWRDTDWVDMEGGAFKRWVFQPSGMCDPMRVQFQSDHAFFEVEFHPLTADIKDETSWVE